MWSGGLRSAVGRGVQEDSGLSGENEEHLLSAFCGPSGLELLGTNEFNFPLDSRFRGNDYLHRPGRKNHFPQMTPVPCHAQAGLFPPEFLAALERFGHLSLHEEGRERLLTVNEPRVRVRARYSLRRPKRHGYSMRVTCGKTPAGTVPGCHLRRKSPNTCRGSLP
jgi:hypothetical protein